MRKPLSRRFRRQSQPIIPTNSPTGRLRLCGRARPKRNPRWARSSMNLPGPVNLDWWGPGTVPAAPSIVWCNFPEHEQLGKPGPKARPALVFKSRYADDPPANRFLVLVAYGTSNLKVRREGLDFTLGNETLLNVLRLPQMTRFDLDRVLWLPWARPFSWREAAAGAPIRRRSRFYRRIRSAYLRGGWRNGNRLD